MFAARIDVRWRFHLSSRVTITKVFRFQQH
jgi:hypothetical protein